MFDRKGKIETTTSLIIARVEKAYGYCFTLFFYGCSFFFQLRIFNYIELIKSPHSIKFFYRLRCQQRTEASLLAWLNSLSLFIFTLFYAEKKNSISVGLRLSSLSTTASFICPMSEFLFIFHYRIFPQFKSHLPIPPRGRTLKMYFSNLEKQGLRKLLKLTIWGSF